MSYGQCFIDSIEVSPNLMLAPMSGVTNTCFRQLIKNENPGAVGLLVTEFISIEALVRDNERSKQMMKFVESERPVSVQIFGHSIDHMAHSAKMIEDIGADIVDINCGCPVPKVVKKGGGCELMRQPEHLEKIIKAVKKAVSIPLTIKIRSGWAENSRNAVEIAKMAEGSGVSMLAIHGRTRKDMYRGDCDWDIISEVCNSVSIPVVDSGDVVDYESAKRSFESGVKGLMIGRGAMANPWVFSEIAAGFRGEHYEKPSDVATVDILEKYLELLQAQFHEKAIMGRMKQLTSQVTRRVRGATPVRKALCMSKSLPEFQDILGEWRISLEESGDLSFLDKDFQQTDRSVQIAC